MQTLPWLPNYVQKKIAETGEDYAGYGLCVLDCRTMTRRRGVWWGVSGQPAEFGFRPEKEFEQFARQGNVSSMLAFNQEAIWRKLCGEQVETLPFPPTDLQRSDAKKYENEGTKQERSLWRMGILVNQEAMWKKLTDSAAGSCLPHPVSADVRNFSGYTHKNCRQNNLTCRLWMNDAAIVLKLHCV